MGSPVGMCVKATFIVYSFLCFSTSAAVHPSQDPAEQFVDRVKKAIQNDEWGRAPRGIRHVLALEPKSAEAHFIAAQVYWHEGARSMAMESLEKAIERQPTYPEAHLLLARCLADNNKPDKAREEVNIAISQGSSGFPAYCLRAEIDIAKGDFETAISSFETALSFSTSSDDTEGAKLRAQLEALREFNEKVKRIDDFEARQKALDIVRPVLLNSGGPIYTDEARALKIQGTVSMVALITENGDVDSLLLFRRLGHGLDEQSMNAARTFKYSPATKGGNPIRYCQKLSFEFNLR